MRWLTAIGVAVVAVVVATGAWVYSQSGAHGLGLFWIYLAPLFLLGAALLVIGLIGLALEIVLAARRKRAERKG